VAKARGFSAAARGLGVPLATINRRVVDLERHMGARTITAPMGFGRLYLQPVALDFPGAFPAITLKLVLVDRVVQLVEENIDLALRISELPDSGLIARPLGNVQMVVSASPAYLERHGVLQTPSDLMRHDGIAWSSVEPLNSWWFHEAGRDRTFPVRTRLSTSSADSAISAAHAGLGLVQTTSHQAEPRWRDGRLTLVLRAFECAPTPVSLVYVRQRSLPLKVRARQGLNIQAHGISTNRSIRLGDRMLTPHARAATACAASPHRSPSKSRPHRSRDDRAR